MAETERPLILLTNDDGIRSPGLWAAAEALSEVGYVTVIAPREQCSGSGRSMPIRSDGIIQEEQVQVGEKTWRVYAVGGSPAQAVQHGILELLPRMPDLVVAGINYGENVGLGVTISGTVGAAMEGAALGVRSMAISIETDTELHLTYSDQVDFLAAAYFAKTFARMLIEGERLEDVDVVKIEVPATATPETPWQITRLSRVKYYVPVRPDRQSYDEPSRIGYEIAEDHEAFEHDSDTYVLRVMRQVSVTPLSIDLTSRVDLRSFEKALRLRKPD